VPSHRNYNCNLKLDGPKDLDMDARRPYGRFNTCEDKAAFINEEGYKFVAVERYVVPLATLSS